MKNNKIWMVSVDNAYSFDSIEKRTLLTLDEKEAKAHFKKMVKDYIKDEIETASELFDKKFLSLSEIIDYIEEIQQNEEVVYLQTSEIHNIEYNYGLDVNKEKTFALFTITKHTKELINNDSSTTEYFEDYYIMLQEVELGKENNNYGLPILDNVSEIDEILESL